MSARKIRGLDDRISAGRVTNSSADVFEIETHKMQNTSYAQKGECVKLFFSRKDASYFSSPKKESRVRVVFNNFNKDYVEAIYDSNWNPVYRKA